MSHCLCGVCKECKARAKEILELMVKAEKFGKKHNCSPLTYLNVLEEARKKRRQNEL